MIPVSLGTARIILLAWVVFFGPLILVAVLALAAEWLLYQAHKRRGRQVAAPAPEPDLAFLANCTWCANLSQDVTDCNCKTPCESVEWCVARYERTATIAMPVIREDQ